MRGTCLLALSLLGCSGAPGAPAGPSLRPVAAETDERLSALWAAADGSLWSVSASTPPLVRQRTADGWQLRSAGLPEQAEVLELWGADGELFACGIGQLWRFSDGAWQSYVDSGDPQPLVLGSADSTVVLGCAYYPRLERLRLAAPEARESAPVGIGPALVWVFAPDSIVALPDSVDRSSWRFRGGSWGAAESWSELPFPDGLEGRIHDVWGAGDELLAVGSGGLILRLRGDRWSRESCPTRVDLHGVYARADGRCVAVGARGTVLLYESGAWRTLATGGGDLQAVHGQGARIFLGGAAGALFELRWP